MNAYRICTVFENDSQVHDRTVKTTGARPRKLTRKRLPDAMIRLSKMTDYAVVVLARMAARCGTLLSASSLAEGTGLPEPTVSKVLKQLARAGLVTSVRGVAGGYRLECAAADLPLTNIIVAMEGPLALTACVEGSGESCALEHVCGLQGRWNKVNRALTAALAPLTLADMMPSRPVLMEKRA